MANAPSNMAHATPPLRPATAQVFRPAHPRSRCGEDGKGYKLTLPRGWARSIGIALKIGVLFVAAASDVGEVADLPVPSCGTNRGVDGRDAAKFSSAEWQGDVVNAAYDGLAGAVDVKSNDLIDSAFMDADTEVLAPFTRLAFLAYLVLQYNY